MWSWGRWRSVTGSCVLSAGSAREVAPGIRALARERCSARRVSCQASLLRLETWGIQGHREPPSGPGRCLPHPPITPAVARGGDERVSGYPDDVCESWAPRCLEGPLTVWCHQLPKQSWSKYSICFSFYFMSVIFLKCWCMHLFLWTNIVFVSRLWATESALNRTCVFRCCAVLKQLGKNATE